jgi:hypothetical protein
MGRVKRRATPLPLERVYQQGSVGVRAFRKLPVRIDVLSRKRREGEFLPLA